MGAGWGGNASCPACDALAAVLKLGQVEDGSRAAVARRRGRGLVCGCRGAGTGAAHCARRGGLSVSGGSVPWGRRGRGRPRGSPSKSAKRTAGFLGAAAASPCVSPAAEPCGAVSDRCWPPPEAGNRLSTERGRASPAGPVGPVRAPGALATASGLSPRPRGGASSPAPSRRTNSVRRSAASTTGPRSSAPAVTASITRASPRATADRRLGGAPAAGGCENEPRSVHDAIVRVPTPSPGGFPVRDQRRDSSSRTRGAGDCVCGEGALRFMAASTEAAVPLPPSSGGLSRARFAKHACQ